MTDPVLTLEDIHAGYGPTKILKDVSLSVDEGEIVSLVGRNGAGKTTTLRAIMGIITPSAGRITYRGNDITTEAPEETVRRGIAYVPEDRRIFPELTVLENLRIAAYGGSDHADSLSIEDALAMFENLDDRQGNNGSSLSGGEQQMLTIARALVGGADLILLDEPTEGLAPLIVEDVVDVIEDLSKRGITVFIVEQNVHVGLKLADRNYVISQGEIVFEGTSPDLESNEEVLDTYLGITD